MTDPEATREPEVQQCLDELDAVVAILEETLLPPGPYQWLRAANRMLGGRRPLDVLAEGGYEQVADAARAYVDGSYA